MLLDVAKHNYTYCDKLDKEITKVYHFENNKISLGMDDKWMTILIE